MSYLPTITVLILIAISLIETILSATWNKAYFKFGIPVFIKNITVVPHHTNIPNRLLFENKFRTKWFELYPPLFFREIENNVYGFRGSLIGLRNGSGIFGVVIFDAENDLVTVKGNLSWGMVVFLLFWLIVLPFTYLLGAFGLYEPLWLIALGYFGVLFINLGIFYFFEYVIFSAIGEFAALSWKRQYATSTEG